MHIGSLVGDNGLLLCGECNGYFTVSIGRGNRHGAELLEGYCTKEWLTQYTGLDPAKVDWETVKEARESHSIIAWPRVQKSLFSTIQSLFTGLVADSSSSRSQQ
jgi:hypothetical protein